MDGKTLIFHCKYRICIDSSRKKYIYSVSGLINSINNFSACLDDEVRQNVNFILTSQNKLYLIHQLKL